MRTVTGREVNVTVAYRLPAGIYNQAVKLAQREGVKLSRVLRRATLRGLRAEHGQEVGDAQIGT